MKNNGSNVFIQVMLRLQYQILRRVYPYRHNSSTLRRKENTKRIHRLRKPVMYFNHYSSTSNSIGYFSNVRSSQLF